MSEPYRFALKKWYTQLFVESVASVSASVITRTLTAPLERAKIVFQTHSEATGQKVQIRGIFWSLRELVRTQGFKSLWRGNLANIIRSVPGHAQTFTMHKMIYRYMVQGDRNPTWQQVAMYSSFAATISGVTACAMWYPFFFCQTVFAANLSPAARDHGRFFGRTRVKTLTIQVCLTRFRLNQLYVGVIAAMLATGVHRIAYFGMYDVYKALFHTEKTSSLTPKTIFMAQFVSVVAISLSHPFDTVARRQIVKFLHTNDIGPSDWQSFLNIISKEGYMGVYKGLLTNIIKSTSSGLMLILTDVFRNAMYN